MITRWIDLRYPVGIAFASWLAYLWLTERTLLVLALAMVLLLLLIGGCRLVADGWIKPTNGGGFPSVEDTEREHDDDLDVLALEEDVLALLNREREARDIPAVALHSDLLYRARRHSLRMIKLPFFGTKDTEDGDVCDALILDRGAQGAGAKVLRLRDDIEDPAAYCVSRWMRWRRSRRILLYPGFTLAAVGVIRSSRSRTLYVTCLLEELP